MNVTHTALNTAYWDRVSSGPKTCLQRNHTLQPERSKTVGLHDFRVADVQKGNKVSATPYSLDLFEAVPLTGTYSMTNRVFYGGWTNHVKSCGDDAGLYVGVSGTAGYFFDQPIIDYPSDLETEQFLMDYSVTQALADLRRSAVNLPLLYAERKQTLAMITSRTRQLSTDAAKLARESKRKYDRTPYGSKKKQLAKDLAGVHLEALFGWLPLVAEIEGAISLVNQVDSTLITGRGRRAEDSEVNYRRVHTFEDWDAWINNRFDPSLIDTVTGNERISARSSITMKITTRLGTNLRNLGFNPGAAAFDLVPLSFVLNFVSNVGDWIAAHDPIPDLEFVRGSTTLWREAVHNHLVTPLDYNVSPYTDGSMWAAPHGTSLCNATGKSRRLNVQRFVYSGLPDPSLLGADNLSWAKALTVSSLAVQRAIKPLAKLRKAMKPFRYKGLKPRYLPPIRYEP